MFAAKVAPPQLPPQPDANASSTASTARVAPATAPDHLLGEAAPPPPAATSSATVWTGERRAPFGHGEPISVALAQRQREDAYVDQHLAVVERALSEAFNAAFAQQAEQPIAFIARHLLGEAAPPVGSEAVEVDTEPPPPAATTV